MDDIKLKAYKTLLYQAFLDIRTLSGSLAWNDAAHPETVEQTSKEIFFIANVFHNLADSSINNLLDFNETDFWDQLDHLNTMYPNTTNYKKLYEQMISEEHSCSYSDNMEVNIDSDVIPLRWNSDGTIVIKCCIDAEGEKEVEKTIDVLARLK